MTDTNTGPDVAYLLGALITDGAPVPWSLDTAKVHAQVRSLGDDDKLAKLRLALYQLFLRRGYRTAAMAVLAQPSTSAPFVAMGAHALSRLGAN